MKITLAKKDTLLTVFFLLFIYFNASNWVNGELTGTEQFILKILLVGILFAFRRRKLKQVLIYYLLTMMLFILITIFLVGLFFDLDVGIMINLVLTVVLVSQLDELEFIKYFCKIMYFLSIASLLGYIIYYLAPFLLEIFPLEIWNGSIELRNLFVTLVPVNMSTYFRNWGIFHEPGYYSVYLIIAYIYELFVIKERSYKVIIIEALALITTFSTAGIFAFASVLAAYFFSRVEKKNEAMWKRRVYNLVMVIVVLSAGWFLFTSQGQRMYENVFEKIFANRMINVSYLNRMEGLERGLEIILNRPLTGGGYLTLSGGNTDVGFGTDTTIINWFATYGIFFGISCSFLFLSYANRFVKSKISKLFLVLSLLGVTISQAMDTSIICYVLIGYNLLAISKHANHKDKYYPILNRLKVENGQKMY